MARKRLSIVKNTGITPHLEHLSQLISVLELFGVQRLDILTEKPCGIEEASSILGMTRETLTALIKDGSNEFPYDFIANRYVFYPSLLRAWQLARQISDKDEPE